MRARGKRSGNKEYSVNRLKEGGPLAQQLLCALDYYEAAFSAWAATPSLLDLQRVETQLDKVPWLR